MMEKIHSHISPKPIHSPPTRKLQNWLVAFCPILAPGDRVTCAVLFGSKSPPGKSQGEFLLRSFRNGTNQLVHPLLHLSRHFVEAPNMEGQSSSWPWEKTPPHECCPFLWLHWRCTDCHIGRPKPCSPPLAC